MAEQLLTCEILGFRSGTVLASVLLECGVASLGEWFLNVSDSVLVSFSRVEKFNEENSSLSPSSGMLRSVCSSLLPTFRDSLSVESWTA